LKKNKETFMQGVVILMFSQFIIKIIGLVYKIYITNKEGFGDAGNAIFSASFQIYTLFLAFSCIGVPNAIAQLISAKSAIGDNKGAYRIFKVAISIFGFLGFLGTAILFVFAEKIANSYLGMPEAKLTIIALAPSVFMVAILSVFRGYFNAKEKIRVTANSQSIEQLLKTIFTFIVVETFSVISNKNTEILVAGAGVAGTVSTFFSLGYLYVSYIKNRQEIWQDVITSKKTEKESVRKIIKSILNLTFPMMIASILATANKSIDAFSIVNIIGRYTGIDEAKLQYGILTGKVESLVVLPYSFNIAFATALIPTISASRASGEMERAKKRMDFSILATILISLPCTGVLWFFSEPILKLLFPNAYLGSTMLKLCSISIVFVAIAQTIGGILQGLGKVKEPVIALVFGVIIKLILNPILLNIKSLNINGAIIATIISHIVTFSISFNYLKRYTKFKGNIFKFIIKPVIATIIMISISKCVYYQISFIGQNLSLIIALIVGIITYIFAVLLLKILSKDELYMLPFFNKLCKKQ